jgi:hypothetical protein
MKRPRGAAFLLLPGFMVEKGERESFFDAEDVFEQSLKTQGEEL